MTVNIGKENHIVIKEIEVKDIMTKMNLPVSDFAVNPYVGCTHACKYCYASGWISEEYTVCTTIPNGTARLKFILTITLRNQKRDRILSIYRPLILNLRKNLMLT